MRRTAALLLGLAGVPQTGRAQEPLAGYWSALETASSVSELANVPVPELEGNGAAIAAALREVRRYELERDRTIALVAQRDLERATRSGQDAWAHFALGVALARGPDVRAVIGDDPASYVVWRHSNAAARAPRELKRALELDPRLDAAAYALAELALDLGDVPLLQNALRALDRESRRSDARALELSSRVLAQMGELARAASAADSLRSAGGNPAVAAHLKAAALLRDAHAAADGARAYFDGVTLLTDVGAEEYFNALRAVLTPSELARWEESDLAGRRDFLRRYWNMQAALSGAPVEQRLAAHYRRLADVFAGGRTAPMGAQAAYDELGDVRRLGVPGVTALLVLRHGDALRTERILFCGTEVLEVPLAIAPAPEECALTPEGRRRALSASESSLPLLRARDRAVAGSTFHPPFRTHLAMSWELLQFRGAGGTTALVASVGLPVASAAELTAGGRLTARVELALVDTADAQVERSGRVLAFDAASMPRRGWVLLHGELETAARGAREYRIGVTDTARLAGRVVGGSVVVHNYAPDSLALSDIVIAPEDGTPSFARGDVRLSLAPNREFHRGESFTLYYEVYGLADSTAYHTEIVVVPRAEGVAQRVRTLLPGAPGTLRLSFDEQLSRPHPIYGVQQVRTVALGALRPGAYSVQIMVTDPAGRTATRERMLRVLEEPPAPR